MDQNESLERFKAWLTEAESDLHETAQTLEKELNSRVVDFTLVRMLDQNRAYQLGKVNSLQAVVKTLTL